MSTLLVLLQQPLYATTINATTFAGNGDFVDIDVDGHTNLDNVSVAGVSTFQDNGDLLDDDRLRFGDGQDLQIYHNSSNNNSVIAE